MKKLKTGGKVIYDDLKVVRCGECNIKMWDQGENVAQKGKVSCSNCGAVYIFEPTGWKVFLK